jgi:hypothetical protein
MKVNTNLCSMILSMLLLNELLDDENSWSCGAGSVRNDA